MKGQKLVNMPVNFRYSDAGQPKEDCAVTVQAPSLDQYAVHCTMVAYAAEASRKMDQEQAIAMMALSPAIVEIIVKARDDAGVQPEPELETDAEMADRVMAIYAGGLGSAKFPTFVGLVG